MKKKKELYICDPEECSLSCVQDHNCVPAGCDLKPWCSFTRSTKYQITEVPEPVYYLDIPEELQFSVVNSLRNANGSKIDNLMTPTSEQFTSIRINKNDWAVDKSWIKQKQPEPTREELQHRIFEIVKFACISGKVSNEAHDIIATLANGKK